MRTSFSTRRALHTIAIGMMLATWGGFAAPTPRVSAALTPPNPPAISSEDGVAVETSDRPSMTLPPTFTVAAITEQEAEPEDGLAVLNAEVAERSAEQNHLVVALRAFDAARNTGPEAVLAFVAGANPAVQDYLQDAVREAQLDAHPVPHQPQTGAANIAGIDATCAYTTVQAAINAAPNGATVRVVGQTISETIDIMGGKVITITGGYDAACAAPIVGAQTTLSVAAVGSVVDVSGGSQVLLNSLVISGGSSFGAGVDVLGSSQVTLDNTDVQFNHGASGGGFYIGSGSAVTLTNGSLVYSNTASAGGGAIVYGRLAAFGSTSDFSTNSSTTDGGNLYVNGGHVYLENADVVAGKALGAAGRGGGIFAAAGAVITLTTSVFVGESAPCCQSAVDGGGIYADNSRIVSLGGNVTILQNQATNNGGGLYLTNGSVFQAASGTNVGYDAQAGNGNTAVLGAGIYAVTSTIDFAGRILNNDASNSGGGLYATASVITLTNASVGGTGLLDPNTIGATGLNGAGLYLINNTHATLANTAILSNTLTNPSTGYAGGAYVRAGSYLTATNSRIEQHLAPSAFDGRGAGLYLYDATVTLSNTQVLSNTAYSKGGAVRMFGASTLNVLGGSVFRNNHALNGEGGGIAATNTPTINLTNTSLYSNTASTQGGAIFLDAGRLGVGGTWEMRYNTATSHGGAVAALGTANVDFSASGNTPSAFSNNTAGGDGGALYITSNDAVQLYATAGAALNLSNNAAANGGALFANSGAFFDVYGQLVATSNQASGSGGMAYLTGTARIWLDDYFAIHPQVLGNIAAQGGAIYAENSPRVECDGVDFGAPGAGNTALTGSGGALYLSQSTFTADNCLFRNNRALQGNGGAIAAFNSIVNIGADYPVILQPNHLNEERSSFASPNAPLATACNPLATACSSLSSNQAISSTASNGNGGAIYTNASSLSVADTTLHRNTAVRGGAIFQEGVTATAWLSNTLIYSNTSVLSFGAGIRNVSGVMTITHGTLANNVGGAGYSVGSAQSYLYNSIIWGNSVAAFGALTVASCNIDQGGTAGPATNPLFSMAGAGENYRLKLGSPAIDVCSTGLPHDLDNHARPTGAQFDMGAYEYFVFPLYLPLIQR